MLHIPATGGIRSGPVDDGHTRDRGPQFVGGHLLLEHEGVAAQAAGRWRRLIVLDDGGHSGGLAGLHLARLDEEDRAGMDAIALGQEQLVGAFGLLCLAAPIPPADVQVDAQVEEGHRDEGREELEGGSAEQEVPGIVKLSETLITWNVALAHH